MPVGYMRVSSDGDRQTTALQRDALVATGVDERHLFQDKASGARDDRPGLKSCLEFLKATDTLIVWKLDRLGAVIVPSPRHRGRTPPTRCGISIPDGRHGHQHPAR